MTVLAVKLENGQPPAFTAWIAQPAASDETCWLQHDSWFCALLHCTFTEFLVLIAEGGKIVDVRHLQEPRDGS